jgi:hypothetical protein
MPRLGRSNEPLNNLAMSTIFDVITVTGLFAVVLAYFRFAAHNLRVLAHLLVSAVAFAVANQAGNAGYWLTAALLIMLGAGYAFLVIRNAIQPP